MLEAKGAYSIKDYNELKTLLDRFRTDDAFMRETCLLYTSPAPSEWAYHLDLWQSPFAVARYYQVPLWSQEHLDAMRPLMKMLAEDVYKRQSVYQDQKAWDITRSTEVLVNLSANKLSPRKSIGENCLSCG